MSPKKRKRGAQRRSKKQHERHLKRKEKAKNERKKRKKRNNPIYSKVRKFGRYVWKIIVSVPLLYRFIQFVFSLFKDS